MDDHNGSEELYHYLDKIEHNPNDGMLWIDFGDFLDENYDNPIKTIEAYKKAQQLLPTKDLSLRLGAAYTKAGELSKGIALIQNSLSKNPRVYGFCFLADIYLQNEMYDKAQVACETALTYDNNFEEVYYLLGEACKKSDRDRAIANYRKAIKIDRNYQLAWQGLGLELVANKTTMDEGIEALKQAILMDDKDGWAKIFLANALWRTGKINDADEQYQSAIEAFPEYPKFRKFYNEFLNRENSKARMGDRQRLILENR